ncbi:MAG TPA: NADPH-dependent FMN reductase, partial [Brevundimonas sp.]|nr:NADPH-dependent FMN reductase [Brevundimonas sp.]
AIDWLSRPSSDIGRVFGGRPVAVLGASPGPFGTLMSQAAWLPVLRALGAAPWFGARVMVTRAGDAFDAEGRLIDADTRRRLTAFVAGF